MSSLAANRQPPESGDVQRKRRVTGGVNDASTVNERWDEAGNGLATEGKRQVGMRKGEEAGTGGWARDARIRKGRSTQTPRRLYSYEVMAINYGFVMTGVVPLPKHRVPHTSLLTPCKAQPVRTEMLSVGFAFFSFFFFFFFLPFNPRRGATIRLPIPWLPRFTIANFQGGYQHSHFSPIKQLPTTRFHVFEWVSRVTVLETTTT